MIPAKPTIAAPLFTDSPGYMEACQIFPWHEWYEYALAKGIDQEAASSGAELMRLCYERKWTHLRNTAGWTDSGATMLWLATYAPELAKMFWQRTIKRGYELDELLSIPAPKDPESGQALLESTLILLIFILMLMGIVNFGQFFYFNDTLTDRLRTGARYGALHLCSDPPACSAAVNMATYNNPEGSGTPLLPNLAPTITARLTGFDNCWKDQSGTCHSPCASPSLEWISLACSQGTDDARFVLSANNYPLPILLFPKVKLASRSISQPYEGPNR